MRKARKCNSLRAFLFVGLKADIVATAAMQRKGTPLEEETVRMLVIRVCQ
jgi:hypothetical protein